MKRPASSLPLASIPPVLTVARICELLAISPAQFYDLRSDGWFDRLGLLVEVQPPVDRRPRYLGEPFARWLSRDQQAALRRDAIVALEARRA